MNIRTEEEYFALKNLAHLLDQLNISHMAAYGLEQDIGGDFEECGGDCGSVVNDCRCDLSPSWYDDDSSFE
jgi:hypothetical protein